ncbi:MAG: adenylosuccinate synthase, partial [Deltaproteobacteria bacterium]|nr:adenylosuccinate synthase [Deltaproteobacteria bacterium]
AVVVNHAIRINGIQEVAITKLDVLNDFDKIKICVGYCLNGKVIQHVPSNLEVLESCEPVYEELDGWRREVKGAKKISELPAQAQRYLKRIEELTHVKIAMVSVGSERNETIEIKNPFQNVA